MSKHNELIASAKNDVSKVNEKLQVLDVMINALDDRIATLNVDNAITFNALKANSQKEYLGYCPLKGYIYSVMVDVRKYSVVALSHDNNVRTLITHTI